MDASAWVTVSLLAATCVAALLALRALGRRGGTAMGGMRVVGRLALDPRRSLVMVEAGGRRFLLGLGDGPIAMLAELDKDEQAATARSPSTNATQAMTPPAMPMAQAMTSLTVPMAQAMTPSTVPMAQAMTPSTRSMAHELPMAREMAMAQDSGEPLVLRAWRRVVGGRA